MTTVLTRVPTGQKIARPLKTLIPLIQQDLESGGSAGLSYYIAAGEKLNEAKEQVSPGSWGTWLSKNFSLSSSQAQKYMRAAEIHAENPMSTAGSLNEILGHKEQQSKRRTKNKQALSWLKDIPADTMTQERRGHLEEIVLHRNLALELIDLGFKALATRLHPDRGGSREGMSRLNRVRAELKDVAKRRRFV